ncbi:MAG TPA: TIGR04255 family protein [Terriglobales bacterium]|nr:TIGR04255 family protein [Terriglobales bacterium]
MPSVRPEDLPDFADPPVVETVLGIQFERVLGWTTAHAGMLRDDLGNREFAIEEHPPLPTVLERFGPPQPPAVEVTFEQRPPANRIWLVGADQAELIQIQADRLIHNWRKQGANSYPRYELVRDAFRREVGELLGFLETHGLGPLRINQCEVSYINHIRPFAGFNPHADVARLLRVGYAWTATAFLPNPEDTAPQFRFVMRGTDGAEVGRLHVTAQPAWRREDHSPILILTLTARGAPLGEGVDGAFAFLDLGRRWIVKGFEDLTTEEMHQKWGIVHG